MVSIDELEAYAQEADALYGNPAEWLEESTASPARNSILSQREPVPCPFSSPKGK